MDKYVIAAGVVLLILVTIALWRKNTNKGSKASLGSSSPFTMKFDPNKKLWYKSTSASLDDIWHDRLEGDNIFSPYNSNYYINVVGLNDKDEVIFSSSWFADRTLRQQIQPLSKVRKIQLALATGSRSVVPADALDGLSYR